MEFGPGSTMIAAAPSTYVQKSVIPSIRTPSRALQGARTAGGQAVPQPLGGGRPFVSRHREDHRVTPRTVGAKALTPDHAVPGGPQPGYGPLRSLVADVGVPEHAFRTEDAEGTLQQHEFGLGVDAGPPPLPPDQGVADPDRLESRVDVVIAGEAHHRSRSGLHLCPRHLMAFPLRPEQAVDVFGHLVTRLDAGERQVLPDL